MSPLQQTDLNTHSGVALSPYERRTLIEEIERTALLFGRTENAIALSPGETPAEYRAPLERLRSLELLWARALPVVCAVVSRPNATLRPALVPAPLPRLRGDTDAPTRLVCSPQALGAWATGCTEKGASLLEARSTSVPGIAQHFAAACLHDWERQADMLAALARFCSEEAEAVRMDALLRSLRSARAALGNFSAKVAPSTLCKGVSGWPAAHHALYALWRQSYKAATPDWSVSPLLHLAEAEPWRLYEMWCGYKILATLRYLGWNTADYRLKTRASGLRIEPATGRESIRTLTRQRAGQTLTLRFIYQPLFPSAEQEAARPNKGEGFASRTHAMQPDFALSNGRTLWLLDPKFRPYVLPGDEAEDVDKMHAYRDAVRTRRGTEAVRAAWCLFPGTPPHGSADMTSVVRAYPHATQERPFGAAGVGALRLRPGDPNGVEWLAALFTEWGLA